MLIRGPSTIFEKHYCSKALRLTRDVLFAHALCKTRIAILPLWISGINFTAKIVLGYKNYCRYAP
jgi:hypothetical protein